MSRKENKENKEISQKVGTKAEYLLKQLTHQSFHSRLELSPVWAKKTCFTHSYQP